MCLKDRSILPVSYPALSGARQDSTESTDGNCGVCVWGGGSNVRGWGRVQRGTQTISNFSWLRQVHASTQPSQPPAAVLCEGAAGHRDGRQGGPQVC